MLKAENLTVEVDQGREVQIHLQGPAKCIFEITKQPSHGAFALDPKTGHLQYRPESDFHGMDTITYIVTDSAGNESMPADVVIVVRHDDEVEHVIEITIEIPERPTIDDILDALDDFHTELSEIASGDVKFEND